MFPLDRIFEIEETFKTHKIEHVLFCLPHPNLTSWCKVYGSFLNNKHRKDLRLIFNAQNMSPSQ